MVLSKECHTPISAHDMSQDLLKFVSKSYKTSQKSLRFTDKRQDLLTELSPGGVIPLQLFFAKALKLGTIVMRKECFLSLERSLLGIKGALLYSLLKSGDMGPLDPLLGCKVKLDVIG